MAGDLNTFVAGERVVLRRFLGLAEAPAGTAEQEDYWQLLGARGRVVDGHGRLHPAYPEQGMRVLVRFDKDLSVTALACHNEVPNSLWILVTDLAQDSDGFA